MFDRYLVRADSLRNDTVDGETVGFSIAVRHANYRGAFASLIAGFFIEVDGTSYPVSDQTVELNGQAPRTLDEIKLQVWEHWDYDDELIVHVALPGGLEAGHHTLRYQQSVLAAYAYLPTDEAWAKEAPEPGTGAGSDKTPLVVTYELELQPARELTSAKNLQEAVR